MREIFLGKPWHWALLALVAFAFWLAGEMRVHVIHFNWFILAVAAGSFAIVLLVLNTTGAGERVTREVLEDGPAGGEDEDNEDREETS